MCNNNGHCRKFDAGTMCPSYRVTRDEQHLTRGRANTLRLALSRPARRRDGLGQRRGARSARPVRQLQGLQARLPHRRRHGEDEDRVPAPLARRARLSLKDKLIARLPDYARRGEPLAAAAEPAQPHRPGSRGSARSCWASRRGAALPRWQPRHFFNARRAGARRARKCWRPARPVVLFVDTFNGFFESENARAALRVLQAAGYTVHVAASAGDGKHLCCGRTYLASGMVDEAKAKARRAARRAAAVRRARHRRSSAWSPRAC